MAAPSGLLSDGSLWPNESRVERCNEERIADAELITVQEDMAATPRLLSDGSLGRNEARVDTSSDGYAGAELKALCRICSDEDSLLNRETPCGCSGSIKYGHRQCLQKWCNAKMSTICEIGHQPYRDGYELLDSIALLRAIKLDPEFLAVLATLPTGAEQSESTTRFQLEKLRVVA